MASFVCAAVVSAPPSAFPRQASGSLPHAVCSTQLVAPFSTEAERIPASFAQSAPSEAAHDALGPALPLHFEYALASASQKPASADGAASSPELEHATTVPRTRAAATISFIRARVNIARTSGVRVATYYARLAPRACVYTRGVSLGGRVFLASSVALVAACTLLTDLDGLTSPAAADGGTDGGSPDAADAADAAPVCAPGTDFVTDPKNCGSCGHDCLGAGCVASTCEPFVIASGIASWHVRVDATHVYLADPTSGQIKRVPKHGGSVEVLASSQSGLYEFVTDGDWVYFQTASGVARVRKVGGSVEVLSSRGNIGFIALDATYVYWSDGVSGPLASLQLNRAKKDGSEPTVLATGLYGTEAIAPSGDEVFFGENLTAGKESIRRVKIDGTGDTKLTSIGARRLVVDDSRIYFLNFNSNLVRSIPRDGGAITELGGRAVVTVGDIASDESALYWTAAADDGGVYRIAKTGGAVGVIAEPVRQPGGIDVDDLAVYWTVYAEKQVYGRRK